MQNLTTYEVYNARPIYPDDISIVSEKESGQVFFREKLSTQLTFVGADYSWIMAQAFDDAILLIFSIKENGVLVKTWYGKFMRTDCLINEIDTIIRVTPEPRDDFNDILSIMDREINIKDLGNCLFLDSGTLTPLVKKLENKGYINRTRSKEDERNLVISITKKGEDLKEDLVTIPEQIGKSVNLEPDEAKFLYKILYKIIECK